MMSLRLTDKLINFVSRSQKLIELYNTDIIFRNSINSGGTLVDCLANLSDDRRRAIDKLANIHAKAIQSVDGQLHPQLDRGNDELSISNLIIEKQLLERERDLLKTRLEVWEGRPPREESPNNPSTGCEMRGLSDTEYVYRGVEGYIPELHCTVRECIDCGCLTPGGPTRCKKCAITQHIGV